MSRTLKDQLGPVHQPSVQTTLPMKDQIAAIRAITAKGMVDYRFSFGKYSGELLERVYNKDKSYLRWLKDQDWIDDKLRAGLNQIDLKQ